MSGFNVYVKVSCPINFLEQFSSPKEQEVHQLRLQNFSITDQKIVISLLDEWYTGRTYSCGKTPTRSDRISIQSSSFYLYFY
jgi:hypothetical protein